MINKTIVLEAWALKQQTPKILLVQGESEGRAVSFQLRSNGQPIDLTGSTVTLYYTTPAPDNKEIFLPAAITDAKSGQVEVIITSLAVATAGSVFDAEIRVTLPTGGNLRVVGFVFVIAKGQNDKGIEASNEYTALDEALADIAGKVNAVNPEISGTVKITKKPIKVMGKNYAGDDTTLLQVAVNASDNLWIGIDGTTAEAATHEGNTYISAGKRGQIRAVLSQEGTTYEMLHRGNVNQVLWEGIWNSGTITVQDIEKYQLFQFEFLDSGTDALVEKHNQYMRGIGGGVSSNGAGVVIFAFTGTCSGNTLTFGYGKSMNVATHNMNDATVTKIIGII